MFGRTRHEQDRQVWAEIACSGILLSLVSFCGPSKILRPSGSLLPTHVLSPCQDPIETAPASDDEYAVIAAALKSAVANSSEGPPWALSPITRSASAFYQAIGRNDPSGLPDDLFTDYLTKNEKMYRHSPGIPLPSGFVMLSWEDPCRTSAWDEMGRRQLGIWLFYISRAGFSSDRSRALVYVERYSIIAAYGYAIFLKKTDNEWSVRYTRLMWTGG
jgi:hypothetical protein